jgi:hypothetical protein
MFFEIGAAVVYMLIAVGFLRHKNFGEAFAHLLLSVCAAGLFYVNGGVDEVGEFVNRLPSGDVSIIVIAPV